jgi:hypothetical protein
VIYRQGDLCFVRVGPVPEATSSAISTAILALGEESGHWHEAVGRFVDRVEADGTRFLEVVSSTTIIVRPESHTHRHEPIVLPPGRYQVPGQLDTRSKWLGQREYTPGGIRGAAD